MHEESRSKDLRLSCSISSYQTVGQADLESRDAEQNDHCFGGQEEPPETGGKTGKDEKAPGSNDDAGSKTLSKCLSQNTVDDAVSTYTLYQIDSSLTPHLAHHV